MPEKRTDIMPGYLKLGIIHWVWLIAEIEARRARALAPDPRLDKKLEKVMRQ
jgi:hypothetical protein